MDLFIPRYVMVSCYWKMSRRELASQHWSFKATPTPSPWITKIDAHIKITGKLDSVKHIRSYLQNDLVIFQFLKTIRL